MVAVADEFAAMLKSKSSILVKAKPGASKTRITGYDPKTDTFSIDVGAKPENNEANEELIRFLGKQTGRSARIIQGKTGKKKTIVFS